MSQSNQFGGAIWTDHALDQLANRGLSKDLAIETFTHPDEQRKGKKKDTTEIIKKFGKATVTLIAVRGNKSEWIIISAWINPPLSGTKDELKTNQWKKYKKSPAWKRVFYDIIKQVGF